MEVYGMKFDQREGRKGLYFIQSDPDLGTFSGGRVLSTKSGYPLNRGVPARPICVSNRCRLLDVLSNKRVRSKPFKLVPLVQPGSFYLYFNLAPTCPLIQLIHNTHLEQLFPLSPRLSPLKFSP
eukprot:sb/3475756/